MIKFKYYGEPVGKGRPRVTVRKGKGKDSAVYAHAYTPKKTKEFEDNIRFEFMASNHEKLPVYEKGVPLQAKMTLAFGVPKSYSKKKTAACLNGEIAYTHKPDADNVVKSVLDALSDAFDDSQVVKIYVEKIYAEEPYVEVEIDEL